MKYITLEQSFKFIPTSEDGYTHFEPHYFTTVEDNGWNKVIYFTNKPKKEFGGINGEQFVYVMSNKYMPDIIKIGYTSLNPYDRAQILSKNTGVPDEFVVDFAYRCVDGKKLENMVHEYFKSFRIRKQREFFKIGADEAIDVIVNIGNSL